MKLPLLWFFDRPRLAATFLVALTAVCAWQLPRLEIDPSADGLMLERDPARQFYEQVKLRFGSDNLTVVLVKADDVFTPTVLGVVKRLTDGLERVEGATRVESLTTVKNIKGDGDSLDTEPLIGRAVPDDPRELARIRADALGNRVFVGNLVAADGRATAITIYTDARAGDREFNRRFTDGVEALIQREAVPGVTAYQIGGVFIKLANDQSIKDEQAVIVPICIAMQLLVLLLAFRTVQGMVIPVSTTLLSIVWTLGLMAMVRLPMNLLTSIVPALLIAISFAEDVHMISGYHLGLEQGKSKLDAIRSMLARVRAAADHHHRHHGGRLCHADPDRRDNADPVRPGGLPGTAGELCRHHADDAAPATAVAGAPPPETVSLVGRVDPRRDPPVHGASRALQPPAPPGDPRRRAG